MEPDVFVLMESDDSMEGTSASSSSVPVAAPQEMAIGSASCVEDESESVMASAQDQREEELQVSNSIFF